MKFYIELFNKSLSFLSTPTKAWMETKHEMDEGIPGNVQSSYVYPMVALCGVAMFLGVFFGNGVDAFSWHIALTKCCGVFVSLFGGYFCSVYILDILWQRYLERPNDNRVSSGVLVGYSMVVVFALDILTYLFPSFFIFRWILQFYLVYIVWEGAKIFIQVPEDKLLVYTLVSSLVILVSPALIDIVFSKLSSMS